MIYLQLFVLLSYLITRLAWFDCFNAMYYTVPRLGTSEQCDMSLSRTRGRPRPVVTLYDFKVIRSVRHIFSSWLEIYVDVIIVFSHRVVIAVHVAMVDTFRFWQKGLKRLLLCRMHDIWKSHQGKLYFRAKSFMTCEYIFWENELRCHAM